MATISIEVAERLRRLADQRQADAEDDGEEQHLQHVVARQGVEDRARNDVEDEAAEAAAVQLMSVVDVGAQRMRVELRRVDVHALARADEIGDDKPDGEGDCRHRLEVNERLDPDPADFLQVARAGDAMHDDAEDDGRHDHRNELEKGVGKEFEGNGEFRRRHADRDAKHEAGEDLREQRLIEGRRASGAATGVIPRRLTFEFASGL